MQDDTQDRFAVVINHEEQYSLWPEHRTPPLGWRTTGFAGTKSACLAHIKAVWTDTTPLSLRPTTERYAYG
jgi:MbtH protein